MSNKKLHIDTGRRIRTVRLRSGLTQKDFARTLGIKQSWVSDLESGKSAPTELLLLAIEYRYKISAHWILTGEETVSITNEKQSPTTEFQDIPPAIVDLLRMATKVLMSENPLASDALTKNILHFSHAIETESRLKALETKIAVLESEMRNLEQRKTCDENDPKGTSDG
jgi:transcriptional regulator with XRE-family HTH domain